MKQFLLGLFILSLVAVAPNARAASLACGDVTGSGGKVDVADATLALQYAVGLLTPTAVQKMAADLNGDNKIDISDVTLILQVAVGLKQIDGLCSKPATSACTETPAVTASETEGPYFVDEFVDERLNRSDIRSDPSTGTVQAGIPLNVTLNIYKLSASGCAPLAGAIVDVWHCSALGIYSDVQQENTVGQKFLRGYQTTDGNGSVAFLTIYPGWYRGRTIHIHFKVRTFTGTQKTYEFTSQLFIDDSTSDAVLAQAPYNSRGTRDTRNANDMVFQNGGAGLILPLTGDVQKGYAGSFNVGLQM